MTDRQLITKYKKALQEEFPDIFIYSTSDTIMGHKNPFDIFGCYRGQFFSVKFRNLGGVLSDHQISALYAVKEAGGASFVLWIDDKINEDLLREWINKI